MFSLLKSLLYKFTLATDLALRICYTRLLWLMTLLETEMILNFFPLQPLQNKEKFLDLSLPLPEKLVSQRICVLLILLL